jgi:cbb3-type cytochrome oxidase maturation protein
MFILFGLIIISLLVATGFLIAFLWAVKNGQFDDDYTPSVRMLFDDEPAADQALSAENPIEKDQKSNNKSCI